MPTALEFHAGTVWPVTGAARRLSHPGHTDVCSRYRTKCAVDARRIAGASTTSGMASRRSPALPCLDLKATATALDSLRRFSRLLSLSKQMLAPTKQARPEARTDGP